MKAADRSRNRVLGVLVLVVAAFCLGRALGPDPQPLPPAIDAGACQGDLPSWRELAETWQDTAARCAEALFECDRRLAFRLRSDATRTPSRPASDITARITTQDCWQLTVTVAEAKE